MKILITGSSGVVGKALKSSLSQKGHQIYTLIRDKSKVTSLDIYWNPETKELNPQSIEGMDAIINLAGENLSDERWSDEQKKKIKNSRIQSTSLLVSALLNVQAKPKVFISASAVGFYGDCGAEIQTEASPSGKGFLADVCVEWETATDVLQSQGVRLVKARFGVVLSQEGGALAKMLGPFKKGLGGVIGPGQQYISWIAIDDLIDALAYVLDKEEMRGPVNFVSPNPVTNEKFTECLGKVLGKPTIMKMPAFAARMLFGEMADEMLLSSIRVIPESLSKSGFTFRYSELEHALQFLIKDV